MADIEKWKKIPEQYIDYEMSTLGRIRKIGSDKISEGNGSDTGYQSFTIYPTEGGKQKQRTIHELMALTFIDKDYKEKGLIVDHISGIRSDNRLVNLQCITRKENKERSMEMNEVCVKIKKKSKKGEEWKVIPDFPNYEISTLGRVHSVKKGMLLTPRGPKSGKKDLKYGDYQIVALYNDEGRIEWNIHQIMGNTYFEYGYAKNGFVIDHINGRRDDNRLENLQKITQSENIRKAKLQENNKK